MVLAENISLEKEDRVGWGNLSRWGNLSIVGSNENYGKTVRATSLNSITEMVAKEWAII